MRPQLILIAICLFFLGPMSCGASDGKEIIDSLRWVETADPIKDVDAAIKSKDYRFLGISGRGVNVPGLSNDLYWPYTKKYGINIIKGTSDIVWGEEHEKLIKAAEKYAESYNKRLLKSLPKLQPSNSSLNPDAQKQRAG